jgi:hypothetical protein
VFALPGGRRNGSIFQDGAALVDQRPKHAP